MHRLDFTETGRLLLTGLGTASLTAVPLRVTEVALLGGTLSLQLDGNVMVPKQGATLRLIDWASFSGSFASFTVGGGRPAPRLARAGGGPLPSRTDRLGPAQGAPMPPTPHSPTHLLRRVLGSPPARVLLLGLVLLLMMGLNGDVMTSYAAEPVKAVQHIVALAIAGFAVYLGYAHFIEQRPVTELRLPGMGRELGIGLLIGAGLYTVCELVLMALGIYRIEGLNPWSYLVPALAMAISSSVFEELLFRGVLFLSLETWLGSWVALAVSSLVFGLTHLMNPEGTLEGALFIAVEAGILLGAAFMLTRRLWLSIGFHLAWNYTQSAIFSGIVSGNEAQPGLIRSTVTGPDLLTGGKFGVESSILALLLCTTTGIVMAVMAARRGKVVPPVWKRKAEEVAPT